MILVDSSVWIDYFDGRTTSRTDWLDTALGSEFLVTGDIILTEVLQGFQNDKDFATAKDLLLTLPFMEMGGQELAIGSAMNCIHNHIALVHSDKDFGPMEKYLKLEALAL